MCVYDVSGFRGLIYHNTEYVSLRTALSKAHGDERNAKNEEAKLQTNKNAGF